MSRGVILLCNNSTIHTKLTGQKRRELFIIRNIPLLSGRQRCQLQWWRWQGHQTRQDLREGRMWPKESCFDPGTWQMSRHYWHSNQTSSLSTDPCRQMTFICSTNDLARSLMMFISSIQQTCSRPPRSGRPGVRTRCPGTAPWWSAATTAPRPAATPGTGGPGTASW